MFWARKETGQSCKESYSEQEASALTWNRPVLIKACRVQPRAALSDKLSVGTCREVERWGEKEKKQKMKEWMSERGWIRKLQRMRCFWECDKVTSEVKEDFYKRSNKRSADCSSQLKHFECYSHSTYCKPQRAQWCDILEPCAQTLSFQSFTSAVDFPD